MRLIRIPPGRGRWSWPWLHWCLWDRNCRPDCPRDIYIHPLHLVVRLDDDR